MRFDSRDEFQRVADFDPANGQLTVDSRSTGRRREK